MDESGERDRGSRPEGHEAGDRVGLGRVVEDHRPPAGGTEAAKQGDPADTADTTDTVEEASEDSFPASDPPPFTSASGG